jgi:hypothetical protein
MIFVVIFFIHFCIFIFNRLRIELHYLSLFTNFFFQVIIIVFFLVIWFICCHYFFYHLTKIKQIYLIQLELWLESQILKIYIYIYIYLYLPYLNIIFLTQKKKKFLPAVHVTIKMYYVLDYYLYTNQRVHALLCFL